jgi:hypothetical protein
MPPPAILQLSRGGRKRKPIIGNEDPEVLRKREYEREKKKRQRANRTQQKKESDNKTAREAMRSKRGATRPEGKEAKREDARKKRSEHALTPEQAKATRERKNEWARNNRGKKRQKIEQLFSNPPPDTHSRSRKFLKWKFHNRLAVFKDSLSFKSLMRDKEVVLVIDGGLGSKSRGFYVLEYSSYPNSRTNAEGGYRCAASYGSCDKKKEFDVGRLSRTFDWEEEGKFVGNNANVKWVVWDPADAAQDEDYKKLFCRGVQCHRPTIDWAESKEGGTDNALFLFNKNEWAAFLESKSSSLPLLKCLPVDRMSARESYEQKLDGKREKRDRSYHNDRPGAAERMRKLREGTQKRLQCKHGGQLHCKHEGCPNFFLTKKEKRRMPCNHNNGRKCSVEGCPNQRRKPKKRIFECNPMSPHLPCVNPKSCNIHSKTLKHFAGTVVQRINQLQQLKEEGEQRWDLTHVALVFVQMIDRLGCDVTLMRLKALWRGTKSKAHIKHINVASLWPDYYGNGMGCSKSDADIIARALVNENIIREIPKVNCSGFTANYVFPGPNAKALQEGNFRFYVALPQESIPVPPPSCSWRFSEHNKRFEAEVIRNTGGSDRLVEVFGIQLAV